MISTSNRKSIPLSVPWICGNAWKYLKDCLDDNWVSSGGPYVDKFEKAVAAYTHSGYAVACSSGTTALHIALLLAGVKPGDEVLVPTLTFIATVNVVRYVGATPIFMDCDDYYNIDIDKVVDFLATNTYHHNNGLYNSRTKNRIAAIIPVHVYGNAVNIAPLLKECTLRNVHVIEDAAEAIGTEYSEGPLEGRAAGTLGKLGCLSFNGNKIITCGGGGMILTDDGELARRGHYLINQAKNDEIYFIHNEVGFNYRMTNLQAALGLSQLELLPNFLQAKKTNYEHYRNRISEQADFRLAPVPKYARNNHWMYCLQLGHGNSKMTRDDMLARMHARGIEARPVWNLNHLQKPYLHYPSYRIEKAVALHGATINLPCSTSLDLCDIDYVVECITQ
jgi:aminotransferase in exopolysaccharide biosynthesis